MFNPFSLSALRQATREARESPYVADRPTRPWLRLAGFIVVAAFLIGLAILVMGGIVGLLASSWLDPALLTATPGPDWSLVDEMGFVILLAGALFALALMLLIAGLFVYQRDITAFLWPKPGPWLARFGWGFLVMMALSLIALPVAHMVKPDAVAPLLDSTETLTARLTYLAVAGVALLVAAAAEEIAFRGVLLKITGALTRHVWLLVVVNGLLFSAIHLDPDPVAFVARALSGMVWAWAALRLGGISFALGAHWANNLFIALFVEPISLAALPGQDIPPAYLALELLTTAVIFVAVELLARRRQP